MPALAVLQVLTGGVSMCRQAGLPFVCRVSIEDDLNQLNKLSIQLHCRTMFDIGAKHVWGKQQVQHDSISCQPCHSRAIVGHEACLCWHGRRT
jgi:hypothetical protein